jgi:phosphoglycolate phosphatase-like HAD superfamily hydrolase
VARVIKIVSDFDGVWTDQAAEVEAVRGFAVEELARLGGSDRGEAAAAYALMVRTVLAAPAQHGWAPDGRISAYVDEDPLIESSAVCRMLAQTGDTAMMRWRDAVLAGGFTDLHEFGEHCFVGGTTRFLREQPPCIVPDAKAMLATLKQRGAELVVVSNSATEKLVKFFAAAGITAAEEGHADLRVRGSARKWQLGETDARIEIAGRAIHVDRPRYREVIADEQPDIVIGDVFSLDLALPWTMRRDYDPAAPRALVLRRHAHTPAWVVNDRAGGAIDTIVDRVGELASVIERLG